MPILRGLHPGELYRIRGCQGCKYLGQVSGCGYCNYYLLHENRRPCKFGLDCVVKELDSDPQKIQVAVEAAVEKYNEIQQSKSEMRVKWDVRKAKQMWEDGVKAATIAEEMGTSRKSIIQYAHRHGWRKGYFD